MSQATEEPEQKDPQKPKASRWHKTKLWRIGISAFAGLVLVGAVFLLFAYRTTPAAIREPSFEHYHFRMQLLVDGEAVDFADKEYQTKITGDTCDIELAAEPIHFHDNKDQLAHIHWQGVSGGMVLKYYGWNFIGGLHGTMGFRFDQGPKLESVPIHGNSLPTISEDDEQFYVYTGDEDSYKQRSWDDFLSKDLEEFLGKKSSIPDTESTSLLDKLFPKAYAHGNEVHAPDGSHMDDDELKELNNLLGNVVIFVQKDKPTDKEVKARFNMLAPLPESSCAG
jgi:hypothetical protein